MIYLPVSLLLFLLFVLFLPFVWLVLTIDVVQLAAAKLGFTPHVALILLVLVILGSTINIPLYRMDSPVYAMDDFLMYYQRQFWGFHCSK